MNENGTGQATDEASGVSRRDLLMTGSLAAVAGRSTAAGVAELGLGGP